MKRKRKKRLTLMVASVLVLFIAAYIFGVGALIDYALSRLNERTFVRVTYGAYGLGIREVVLEDAAFFWKDESTPFATTNAIRVNPWQKSASIEHLAIERRGVIAAARGTARLAPLSVDVKASLPPTPCAGFLGAIPSEFCEELSSVRLSGKIAGDAHVVMDKEHKHHNLLDVALDNGCRIDDFGKLPTPDDFRRPFKHRVYDENKKSFDITTGPGADNWTNFEDMTPFIRDAVVEAEDTLFYKHDGILLSRIQTAAEINLARDTIRYGASTITMQTAKNLFLSREKTIARKLQEVFFVWYLESNFTKDEILTLYLNVAEFGPSLYGIRAAANHYFECSPAELTLRQAAFLAKVLPSPIKRHQAKTTGKVPHKQAKRIRALLQTMVDSKRITEEQYDEALSKEISFDRKPPPENSGQPTTTDIEQNETVTKPIVTRISRPRLKKLCPPLSKIVSERESRGLSLSTGR